MEGLTHRCSSMTQEVSESATYPTPDITCSPRGRVRTVPMQVLNLGMPRTGTTSISAALNKLGLPCYHSHLTSLNNLEWTDMWVEALQAKFFGRGKPYGLAQFDELLGEFAAVADAPAICFTEELIRFYPDTKVIIVQRDIDRWIDSYDDAVLTPMRHPLAPLRRIETWIGPLRQYLGGSRVAMGQEVDLLIKGWLGGGLIGSTREQTRELAKHRYREHYKLVKSLVPAERLLEYDLGSGWEPLCRFLGRPIPNVPFPRLSDRDEFKERARLATRASFRALFHDFLIILGILGALLAIVKLYL